MNETKNFFNDKNLINDYMNVWAMIHNTPDEELSEMGKNTKLWLELNEHYAYKLIHMNKGYQSSLQWHEKKVETNYVIEGEAEVLLEKDDGTMESRSYKAGDGWCVPLKTKHRVIATTDYTALECSTAHLNDCIRFADDSDRGSGKIEKEHEGN